MEPDYQQSLLTALSGLSVSNPDLKIFIEFLVLAILLLSSALMSASEIAYFAIKPGEVKKIKSTRSKNAGKAIKLYDDPERLLSTILVTNNVVNISFLFLAVYTSVKLFDLNTDRFAGYVIILGIIIFLLLLFGEVMPKVYASRNHIKIALFMSYPLTILEKLFYPITYILISSTDFVRKRQNVKYTAMSLANEPESDSENNLNEDEKILKGIANFGNTNVSAIMCPRIDVTAIEIKSGFDKIIPVIINSGFSRIPVYSGSFDSVKGILYAKDVLPYTNYPSTFKWQSLLRPSYFVPETKKINDLLKEFQLRKIHMAIVIDEYGGTSGIVTLEDILEEIVGEITDENDDEQPLYNKLDDTTYIFEGKILLNDFYKALGIEEDIFEEVRGESETLAGLILELTGEIPQKDQLITSGNFTFRIESVDRRRIREIRVELSKGESDNEKN